MDSFLAAADDLDRVLDEFEQNEESFYPGEAQPNWKAIPSHLQGPSAQCNMSGGGKPDFNLERPSPHANGLSVEDIQRGGLTNGAVDGDQRSQSDAASSSGSELLIDLSEADFAPSAKPSPLLSALQESLASQSNQEGSEPKSDAPNDTGVVSDIASDSNSQLDKQDLTTYMSSGSTRSMSISDLQSIGTSSVTEEQGSRSDPQPGVGEVSAVEQTHVVTSTEQNSLPHLSHSGMSNGFMEGSTVQDSSPVDTTEINSSDSKLYIGHETSKEPSSETTNPPQLEEKTSQDYSSLNGGENNSIDKSSSIETVSQDTRTNVNTNVQSEEEPFTGKGSPASNSLSSSTPPVDTEIMQEYMRQGARPKLPGYRTPEQSPLKNTVEKGKEAPRDGNARMTKVSGKGPVIGFGNLQNVTVSQSDLDELDRLDSKPLACDVSGDSVPRPATNAPYGSPSTSIGPVHPNVNTTAGSQQMGTSDNGVMPQNTAPDSLRNNSQIPSSVNTQPTSGLVPVNTGVGPQSSSLLVPNEQETIDDRVSPLSKILNRQYEMDIHSHGPKVGSNELSSMDPFYGGKQFESSTEEERPSESVDKLSEMPSTMQVLQEPLVSQNVQPEVTVSRDSVTLPESDTMGFAIDAQTESVHPQSSLGTPVNHLEQIHQQALPENVGNQQYSQQGSALETTLAMQHPQGQYGEALTNNAASSQEVRTNDSLQDLAPVQSLALPAGAPPQLSTAQPIQPGMVPEMGIDAQLADQSQELPPDPPTYQQVEQATTREHPIVSRQGLTLNFDHTNHEQVNGYGPSLTDTPQDYVYGGSESSHFTTPPNVALTPDFALPADGPNGVTEASHGMVPGDSEIVVENGGASIPEGIDPMIAENNALNAQHMLPEQDGEGGNVAVPGEVAPIWIPDSEAPTCMKCGVKFTFRKRRHHCRACGKVFCSKCCNVRIRLKYMDSKEARVCVNCLNAILTAEALERVRRQGGNTSLENSPAGSPAHQPAVGQAAQSEAGPAQDGSIQRSKSVLRRPMSEGSRPKETRNVHFSDGTAPGMDSGQSPVEGEDGGETPAVSGVGEGGVTVAPVEPPSQSQAIPTSIRGIPELQGGNRRRLQRQGWHKSLIPEDESRLPPVILTTEVKGEFSVDDNPSMEKILSDLKSENPDPVVFVLSKNLMVVVQIVDLNCCVNRTCWCFSSKGLATVGQDEVVVVLECLPEEKDIPRDIFCHMYSLYEDAKRGITVTDMSHTLFAGGSFLGSRDHGGFLYIRPTFQCLQKLILPEAPYLVAVLLQKWETPWAKVFPLRLLLRLGAEFRYYPCPLMSVRFRKPVFGEIGHTIMNLLADFKNYQYKLPVIRGVVIHMQDRQTVIKFPRNRYDELMKVLNNSNEHVMALAAAFSQDADSHLVCMQNDQGTYQTQAINIQNKPRKVTGASFVVFNGALKASSGLTAKSSIVEDGLMVQIRPETMAQLKEAMRQMQEVTIPCGSSESLVPEETVLVQWVDDDTNFNVGVTSPIDGRTLAGVESVRIHNSTEYHGHSRAIRWTEVFFLQNGLGEGETLGRPNVPEPVDLSRLAESLATAFCLALSPNLNELREAGLVKLGLRVTIDMEQVGYESGSKGHLLPPQYMNNLDNELIPVVHGAVSQHEGAPVILELIFHIVD
ncbi:uncharacterized protein [Diadema antillarum]|uniref:uncharacterized protein n=1 Tax=Diadema antillarum TaxID=105358 RepID=UPI003A8490D5